MSWTIKGLGVWGDRSNEITDGEVCSRPGCVLDYRHMRASDMMTQNTNGFIIQRKWYMQIIHFIPRILSTGKKSNENTYNSVWATLCRSTIDSYNSSIRVLYDTENTRLPHMPSSIRHCPSVLWSDSGDNTLSGHDNTIHKHAIHTFVQKVRWKAVLTSYVVSSFIQTPRFRSGNWTYECAWSQHCTDSPYREVTSSFLSTRPARECAWSHKVEVLMSNGRCSVG